jgi:flap endonuclease-1
MIKIYTTPNCSYCDKAKKFFANEGIEFEAVDITEDEDAMKLMREKGFMGVPVIESPGEAEAQCAAIVKQDLAYATASEDMDSLTFGTNVLLRGFNSKKEPIIQIELNQVLEGFGMS